MQPPAYVAPTELGQYGLIGTPQVYLDRASALIDALLLRPEGLIWMPDGNGWPCYQARLTPRLTLTTPGPIAAGTSVDIPLDSIADNSPDQLLGEVVILDRGNPSLTEACVIAPYATGTAADRPFDERITSLRLQRVVFDHPGPVSIDFGLVCAELKRLPEGRPLTRLASWPLARVVSAIGRYSYGRHTGDTDGHREDLGLLNMMRTFASVPLWQLYPINAASWDAETATIWLPAGIWLNYFTETKIRYVAGWALSAVPETVKQAVAGVALGMKNQILPSNINSYRAGDTEIKRAVTTVLDNDTTRLLRTYRARQIG